MVELALDELRHKIRWAQEPDNPNLITLWLAGERCCESVAQHAPCPNCSNAQQRRCYEQQFHLLLETILDELLPAHWRCSCLDLIYQPLQRLKALSNTKASNARLLGLYHELAITSHYVRASLMH